MSQRTRQNKQQKRNQEPRTDSNNARDRARAEASLAARKKRDIKIVGAIAVAMVLIGVLGVGGYLLYKQFGGPRGAAVAGPEQVIGPLDGSQPIVYGSTPAAKTVDIYLDFSCPHCANFEKKQGANIQKLADSGEFQIAYHPLSFMKRPGASVSAANAFACAAQRGFGQGYMQQLFNNQGLEWTDRQLINLAQQVGGPAADDISGCISRDLNGAWVDAVNDGPKPADFTGTPAIYVGGTKVDDQAWQGTPETFAEALRTTG